MRLESLKIENYKCIESAEINFTSNMMVLVGPNNCGKTTILDAIRACIEIIKNESVDRDINPTLASAFFKTDKPHGSTSWLGGPFSSSIILSDQNPKFCVQFSFQDKDYTQMPFLDKNTTDIKINISFKGDTRIGQYDFELYDNNDNKILPWGKKAQPIIKYITNNFTYLNIAAARDGKDFSNLMDEIIFNHIKESCLKNKRYQESLQLIHEIESQSVKHLEPRLIKELSAYLPEIKKLSISTYPKNKFSPLSEIGYLHLNDQHETTISDKGHGTQSLATLSLTLAVTPFTLVAIDEPENHLHPGAIRKLKNKIYELTQKSQVILATHSPVLINRSKPSANILVENNTATPAQSMRQIRESLGVELGDSLNNAELVLLVEGDNDEKVLTSYLSHKSETIKKGLDQGKFAICSTGGTSHMLALGVFYNQSLCKPLFLLDNDQAGNNEAEKIQKSINCPDQSFFISSVKGKKETELEDCITKSILIDVLSQNDLDYEHIKKDKKNAKLKFSEQLKNYLETQGYPSIPHRINQIKIDISTVAASTPETAFNEKACPWLDRLIKNIEEHLNR